MNNLDLVQRVLEELGPTLEQVNVYQAGDGNWLVSFDEQTLVELEFDEDQNKLCLSIEVGDPPKESRFDTYEALLIYNYLGNETGGVRMALDGPSGAVVQTFDMNADGLDVSKLIAVLSNFVDKARIWREMIQRGIASENNNASQSTGATLDPGLLRV